MEALVSCTPLAATIALTASRCRHIVERHPEMTSWLLLVIETIRDPEVVRKSRWDGQARLLHRWYPEPLGGKHLVVVVRLEPGRGHRGRVLTAYLTSRAPKGPLEWTRS